MAANLEINIGFINLFYFIFRPINGGKQCFGPNSRTLECAQECIEKVN